MERQSAEFMKDFIGRYRAFPCLWKVKSRDYFNKFKKAEAYGKLVEVCRKYYPTADVNFVKLKIQNMRTVYKKELNKVEMSKRSGAGEDEVYMPRLWYFDLLAFTKDQEVVRPSPRLVTQKKAQAAVLQNCSETKECSPVSVPNATSGETGRKYASAAVNRPPAAARIPHTSSVYPHTSSFHPFTSSIQSRKRNREANNKTSELLQQAKRLLSVEPDEYEGIGINVACKMRRMEQLQRIYCEKLLTDLLTKGLLGQLNEDTVISNRRHMATPSPTPYNRENVF